MLLALVPIGTAFVVSLVRWVENTVLQAILTCAVIGLVILAITLIARSQLDANANEPQPIPDADRVALDSLEPLHETDQDQRQ